MFNVAPGSEHLAGCRRSNLDAWIGGRRALRAAGVRPLPAWARILDHESISQSKYKAMYIRTEKRLAQRYQFLVSYTLQSARDDNPQAQIVTPSAYNLDRGPSGIERRNVLVASGSAELPWRITLH